MSSSFHSMRKSERHLPDVEALRLLTEGEYGILSTVGEDGFPYGVPLSYVFDGEKCIYFHCAKDVGLKLKNIRAHSQVCFTVVGKTRLLPEKFSTQYESVIAFGCARFVEDDTRPLVMLAKKYSPGFEDAAAAYIERAAGAVSLVAIEIEHLCAKGRFN